MSTLSGTPVTGEVFDLGRVDGLEGVPGNDALVDPGAVGLAEFGRPAGYTRRQVERWQQQYGWAFEVTAERRTVPVIEEVGDWLAANVPADHPHTLVHGDYKLDNVMFAPGTPPRLVSVFDWELSTLGDPRADLGWLLVYWYDAGDPPPAVPELTATFMAEEGYPDRQELVERYESRTGVSFEHERFYRALAVYKLGALGEMFLRRYLEGNSDDPMYPLMEERVPACPVSPSHYRRQRVRVNGTGILPHGA